MKKNLSIACIGALMLITYGCSTEVRLVTEPVSTCIESPFFGTVNGEDIYAEIGFNLSSARGVEVLSSLIRATVLNTSTLGITVQVYVSTTGTPDTLGKVKIFQTPPAGLVEDAEHRILDTSIPAMEEREIYINGSLYPLISQGVGNGALWIYVHGHITGIAINPRIWLKNLIIDATILKKMDNFLPAVDLL